MAHPAIPLWGAGGGTSRCWLNPCHKGRRESTTGVVLREGLVTQRTGIIDQICAYVRRRDCGTPGVTLLTTEIARHARK